MSPRAPVLLLTHSGDHFTIDRVHAALGAMGVPALRVDTDLFPARLSLEVRVQDGRLEAVLRGLGEDVALHEVPAAWLRRSWPAQDLDDLDPEWRPAAAAQASTALGELLPLLGSAYWINPPAAELQAESKLLQLVMAARAGLEVPETLLANAPEAVRSFATRHDDDLVTKLLVPLSYGMTGGGPFVYTNRVGPDELATLEGLRWAPQLFQPRLEKAHELRAVFVEDGVFAAAVDAGDTRRGRTDWRATEPEAELCWRRAELPPAVAERTHGLLRTLGLRFAAVDFVVQPDGRHVFLDLNPGGEWGWLERDLELPISAAIAECLARAWRERQDLTPRGPRPAAAPATPLRRRGDGPPVLLVTHGDDHECVERVAEEVAARGGWPVRLDSDRYPLEIRLSTRQEGARQRRILIDGDQRVALDELRALWFRRLAVGRELPWSLGDLRAPSIDEARRTLLGTLANLPCFQLDPWVAVRRADAKELQLRWAAELGLDTPRTLVSNDPEEVRVFFDRVGGRMITKMQHSFAVYRGAREQVVFTETMSHEDLRDLDGLRFCPMTFQEELEKALEIRATVVGREVFAAAVDSRRFERAQTDWRRDGVRMMEAWKPYELPAASRRALLALHARFGLNYGASDFVLTPEGRLVFLELNAVGEYFWLELYAGLPISGAIAATLLGLAERNPSTPAPGTGVATDP